MQQRSKWIRSAPALVVVLLMRARFVFAPITSDEGGYLAVARGWSRGLTLYRDVWVDRPQALLVVFRAINAVGLGNPVGVRLLAIAFALVGTYACGSIAASLVGEPARAYAAICAGALISVPKYEGFIANGELLSGAAGAAGLAILLYSFLHRTRPWQRGLFLSGVVGAFAMGMKQSGFDAMATGIAALTIASLVGQRSQRRARLFGLLSVGAGFLVPFSLMAVHGALTGWHRWWFAIIGYRSQSRSALENANWNNFVGTWKVVEPVVLPAMVVLFAASVGFIRRGHARTLIVFVTWLLLAFIAFLSGGQFFRHYWIILMFPLGTMLGAMLSTIPVPSLRRVAFAAVLVGPAVLTIAALTVPRSQIGHRLIDDPRLSKDEDIAKWFDQHRAPGDQIYALCAAGGLYGNVTTDPPYPYLWFDSVHQMPDGQSRLDAMFESPHPPRFVAEYQTPLLCNPSGAVLNSLTLRYHIVATIDDIHVYELSS